MLMICTPPPALTGADVRLAVIFQQAAQLRHQFKYARLSAEVVGKAPQRDEVRPPRRAALHCAEYAEHMAGIIQPPHQLLGAETARVRAQRIERRAERGGIGRVIGADGVVVVPPE